MSIANTSSGRVVTERLAALLRAQLDPVRVITDLTRLRTYECDGITGYRVVPAIVALPESTEEVALVVAACARAGVPFVARGAGTGLSGGALPVAGGVVVSLARMRRVLEIDLENQRMTVEPGVTNADISRAVAAQHLYFAPDPSSQTVCTIGGNIAENSGGAHCLKYGFTSNHVHETDRRVLGGGRADHRRHGRRLRLLDEGVCRAPAGRPGLRRSGGRVRRPGPDISELLVELGPVAVRGPIDATVAYHDACHLRHAQGIVAQPRAALAEIPSLRVVDIPEADICCGSAGIYNLVQPEPAEKLGRRKVEHIVSTKPDAVATSNAGCLLQIRRYLDAGIPVFHPIELIDASIRGASIRGLDPLAG